MWLDKTQSSPYLNRFVQPDIIVPDLSNPQSWNRYSYVTNRPVNFSDPTGHKPCGDGEEVDCSGKLKRQITTVANCSGAACRGGDSDAGVSIDSSGTIISAFPNGPACTVVITYCTISETNDYSYLVGSGGSIYSLSVAVSSLSSEVRNGQIIIYGTIPSRNIVGINPYTRHISLTNAGNLSSASQGAWSSVGSVWTWAGIAVSGLADTFTFANGDYTVSEYSAALVVDVGTGLISAAISGAVTGALVGTLAGFTAGMGIGAVPGMAAGIILGAAAGIASYYVMNNYKDEAIAYMAPGIDLTLHAASSPNPYSGIMLP